MCIDPDWVSAVADAFTALVTVGAVLAAWSQVKQWRDQKHGVARIDAAHAVHLAALKVRVALEMARDPAIWRGELPDDTTRGPGQTEDEAKASAHERFLSARWRPVGEAMVRFEDVAVEAEVFCDTEIRDLATQLRRQVRSAEVAMGYMIRNIRRGNDPEHQIDGGSFFANSPATPSDGRTKELNEAIDEVIRWARKNGE